MRNTHSTVPPQCRGEDRHFGGPASRARNRPKPRFSLVTAVAGPTGVGCGHEGIRVVNVDTAGPSDGRGVAVGRQLLEILLDA